MINGYAGTILRVDLSNGVVTKQALPEDLVNDYVGGRGFIAKMLYEELPPDTDPLGEENMVIIATGPMSAHFLPASGKTHFGSKSPATGGYGDSNVGGHFGPALKYAGYDVLILTGKAQQPSYLFIEDETVEIRPADQFWGQGTNTVEKMFKEELGEDFQIITIGPAGEKLVKFACIGHDFGRQAGRTGIAAVFGSKNLKAVAVKGTGSIPVFDIEALYKKGKQAFEHVFNKPGFKGWVPEGTAGITNWVNMVGAFPTRNFQTSYADFHEQINGKAIVEKIKITDKGCFFCPTPCGKYGKAKTTSGSAFVEGPEFESIALLGGNLMLTSIEEVAYANYVCDELGLDSISAGVVVSWVLECYEKGIINATNIGREVKFGDLDSIVYLLNIIAKREGMGDLLAEGVKISSEKLGHDTERFAIQVKGLEWTGYECRNAPGMMLSYMTSDIGAHHARSWVLGHDIAGAGKSVHDLIAGGGETKKLSKAEVRGKSKVVMDSQHLRPLFDVLGICRLQFMEIGFEVEHYEELFYLITGKQRSWQELLQVSEKIWHLTRCINVREVKGYGRNYDYPPRRFYEEPIPDGPNEGNYITKEEIDLMLDEYYEARGWDKNGIPKQETIDRFGLSSLVQSRES